MRNVGGGRAAAVVLSAMVGTASLLGLGPALAAQTTAHLFHYPSPGFTGSCSTGGSGSRSSSTTEVTRKGTELVVTVQLTGAAPNATYFVGALQEGNCFSSDATITTDASGDASVQFQKALAAGPKTVIVDVVEPIICSAGCVTASWQDEYRSAALKI